MSPGKKAGDEAQVEIVNVRRRQDRAIQTRARIIACATQAFVESGFEGATTRAIAERAGIRHALVIHHFENKNSLWQSVMRDVLSSVEAAFAERMAALDDIDDVTKLRLIQADFIRIAAERPELHWLISDQAGKSNERLDWLVENFIQDDANLFIKLIRAAQAAGRYVEGEPYHLHYLFLGAAARIFMLSGEVERVLGRSPFDPAFVEEHIETCQRLFFR